MNKLVVDLLQQKGLGCWKVLKKRWNRKDKCFLSSQTRWSWQITRACTSFWTCSSSPGHCSHTQEPSSSYAAASTLKEWNKLSRCLCLFLGKTCLVSKYLPACGVRKPAGSGSASSFNGHDEHAIWTTLMMSSWKVVCARKTQSGRFLWMSSGGSIIRSVSFSLLYSNDCWAQLALLISSPQRLTAWWCRSCAFSSEYGCCI